MSPVTDDVIGHTSLAVTEEQDSSFTKDNISANSTPKEHKMKSISIEHKFISNF